MPLTFASENRGILKPYRYFIIMFKKGDVVQLKSGGPKMTVQRLVGDDDISNAKMIDQAVKVQKGAVDGDPMVQWFNGSEFKSDTFGAEMVKKVEED